MNEGSEYFNSVRSTHSSLEYTHNYRTLMGTSAPGVKVRNPAATARSSALSTLNI